MSSYGVRGLLSTVVNTAGKRLTSRMSDVLLVGLNVPDWFIFTLAVACAYISTGKYGILYGNWVNYACVVGVIIPIKVGVGGVNRCSYVRK